MSRQLPAHVGIIPDGNRRWARRNGWDLLRAYLYGYENVVRVVEHLYSRGVRTVSVYGLSYDNCMRRSPDERRIIEEVAVYALRDMRGNESLRRRGVRLLVLGQPSLFSKRVAVEARKTVEEFENGDGGLLVLLICYSGTWEARWYSQRGMTPPSLLIPPVDLIIRTGGARRLSGFLPLAAEYAELYFTDKLWPDFTVEDADAALEWFAGQKRNFGR